MDEQLAEVFETELKRIERAVADLRELVQHCLLKEAKQKIGKPSEMPKSQISLPNA